MNTDLWLEARAVTAAQPAPTVNLIRKLSMSVRGAPTTQTFAPVNRGDKGLLIDLNKYRPGRDLKKFQDAGVDIFILRIGGPTYWVSGNYRYQEDATWRPYMEQLEKLGLINSSIGYIVHNAFEDWRLTNNIHVDLLNQWTGGGYMPAAFFLDHEIAKEWSGGVEVKCTGYNLTNSLAAVTDKIVKKFKKVCGIYTARWFMDQNDYIGHETYLDNVNRPPSAGGVGKQRPMWYAWYPQQALFGGKEYPNLESGLEELLVPNGEQIGRFLQCGSYSLADAWQFTDRLKLPGDASGVDASITLGSLDAFRAAMGLGQPTTPPVEPPTTPPPVTTDLENRVAALETWARSFI